jgi:predicted GNAT family acetyltransferase
MLAGSEEQVRERLLFVDQTGVTESQAGCRDTPVMLVTTHDDASAFLIAADPFFRADPFSANVIAVVAARVAAGDRIGGPDRLFITVEGPDGEAVGLAMQTPPHPLFVSRMPQGAAAALADSLAGAARDLPGVNGARDSTTAFSEAWCRRTNQTATIVTAMRMYRLEKLNRPRQVSGEAIAAAVCDTGLVADWLAAFHDEATPHTPREDWSALAQRRITAGQVHLWRDRDAPVAMAAVSAPAAGVARVGPVYTPVPARRRGYGAAVTAAATAAAIAAGIEHVVLYTDLANPTSNSIYQAIGYRPDHDAEERAFH